MSICRGELGYEGKTEVEEYATEERALQAAELEISRNTMMYGYVEKTKPKQENVQPKEAIRKKSREWEEGKYVFCKEYSVFYDISKHIDELSETDIEELRAYIESLNPRYEKPKVIIRDYMCEKIKNEQPIQDLYNHISSDFGTGSVLFVNIESVHGIRVEWKCEIHFTLNSYESLVEKYGSHEEIEEILENLNFIYLEDFPVTEDLQIPKIKVIGTDKYEDWLEIEPCEWYVVRD